MTIALRAAVLRDHGAPAPFATSKPVQIEDITLAPPEAGEVLVRMAHAGVCHSDLSVIAGVRQRKLPIVLGHEGSGIVERVGSGVTRVQPGDHVVFSFVSPCGDCDQCLRGRAALCVPGRAADAQGTLRDGSIKFTDASGQPLFHHSGVSAFAERVVAKQESLVRVDADIPLAHAALFGCAVTTGAGAVFNTDTVRPGSTVAVFGLGGVGLSAVMAARVAGAREIIAVDLVDSKLELARELGATATVNAAQDAVASIVKMTSGGVDVAIESVGSVAVLTQAYDATAQGGTTITVGLPRPDAQLSIPAISLVSGEKTLRGSYLGSSVPRRDIPRLMKLYRAGLLPVDRLLSPAVSLDEINVAFDRLATGQVVRQTVDFGLEL